VISRVRLRLVGTTARESRPNCGANTVGARRLVARRTSSVGFEVRGEEHTALPDASRSVTSRGVTDSRTSPNVSPRPANHGQFAALVLHGFPRKLVSPREAAAVLGVNRETIYRLCARRELAHVRVGSALRIDLAAYLAGS